MLSVARLSKRFVAERETVKALEDINVVIERGSFFTLVGPSGCGKSTLLRCLAGLERPDTGEIRIGEAIAFSADRGLVVPSYRRNLGMVFQSYAIWPHMTVYANVAFPLDARGAKDVRERTMRALSLVGLEALHARNASRLSGGQQQRVALARAIVGDPDVLLLDEPLSNLDAALREQMRGELRSLQTRLGVTTICVTHDQSEALSMSDHMGIMSDGKLVEVAAPEEIYNHPKSLFAAQFIGGANIIDGAVVGTAGGETIVETTVGRLRSADPSKGAVKLFVRPEKVVPLSVGRTAAAGANVLDARIVSRRFGGNEIDLDLVIRQGSGETGLRCRCGASFPGRSGDAIQISIQPADLHLLAAGGPAP